MQGFPVPLGYHLEGQAVAILLQAQRPARGRRSFRGLSSWPPTCTRSFSISGRSRGEAAPGSRAGEKLRLSGLAMLAWPWAAPAPGWTRGFRGPQRTIPWPRLEAYRSGADVPPRRARASWGLGRLLGFSRPAELRGAASLPPRGAPGSWSLQPHSSLRPTSLVLPTAQMGGEGAESSFRSRETAPLLSEAR